mgnify:CR=1 FL=1
MYAVSFDMEISKLKEHYGEPYNRAYDEIRALMHEFGFDWTQGSLYISNDQENNLTKVYKMINQLSKINWFKQSVRDIRTFKVEDWSDFTDIVKS